MLAFGKTSQKTEKGQGSKTYTLQVPVDHSLSVHIHKPLSDIFKL
jgi:hypothetical protein